MTFRKWGTLVNGTTLYVMVSKVGGGAVRASRYAGLRLGRKPEAKVNEPKEMNSLLKKLGAKKMTAKEYQRFRPHLEKR